MVDDKEIRFLFDEIDVDHGGTLDRDELKQLVIGLGERCPRSLRPAGLVFSRSAQPLLRAACEVAN